MITWATTLDPQTSFSAVSSSTGLRRNNPGGGASITDTFSYATTVVSNWSRSATSTEQKLTTGGEAQSESGATVSVLATTDATASATALDRFSESYEAFSTISVRSLFFSQTTTQATRSYTYRPTTTTSISVAETVSALSGELSTTSTQSATATTMTHGSQQSAQSSYATTTTVTNETIATPLAATIVQADYSEVIWAANTSAATSLAGSVVAASAFATTATRTTIFPHTQTTTAISANTEETTSTVLPELSVSLVHDYTEYATATVTLVSQYTVLPHATYSTTTNRETKQATTLNSTLLFSEETTWTKSPLTETIWLQSLTTTTSYLGGISFAGSLTTAASATREFQQLTCESSTLSFTEEVEAFSGSDSDGFYDGHITYTWTASTYESTSQALTSFAKQAKGIATSMAMAARSREFATGVRNATGGIALGYSCPGVSGPVGEFMAPVSRGASNPFPGSYELLNTASSTTGTLSIYGLSATLSTPTTTSVGTTTTDTTVTQTALFTTRPGTGLSAASMPSRSAFDASGLGSSETIFHSIPRGVYSSGTTTFSTSGQTSSFSRSNTSSPWVEAITFLRATSSENAANPMTWSVTRNSHSDIGGLTEASNYSAP